MKARKVIVIVFVCVLLAAGGVGAWFYFNNEYYIPEDLSPADSYEDEISQNLDHLIGEVNYDGNTAENLKYGGLAAIQGEWIYYGRDSLVRENIYTGEKVILLTTQGYISNIAVCGPYVYFVRDSSGIYRIRLDGTGHEFLQSCEGVHWTFYFEDEYLYFEKPTQIGSSSYSYTLSRLSVNDINHVEEIYSLASYETLVGVYQGYAIIIDKYDTASFILYNIATKESKTVTNEYNFGFVEADAFHFDQGNIIYAPGGILVYNIESDTFTAQKTTPYGMYIEYVCDDKYYFHTGGNYSSKTHGYTKIDWLDGDETLYNELGQERLDLVNVVGDKIYLYDRLGKKTLYRTSIDGSNWETLSN